jgi:hypothetical protein
LIAAGTMGIETACRGYQEILSDGGPILHAAWFKAGLAKAIWMVRAIPLNTDIP